jgi:predicted dehydrogenase
MNRRQFLSSTAIAGAALGARGVEPPTQFRVAVIGHTGRGNYGHGIDTMWLQLPETRIVAVADPDAKGLESALQRLKADRGFADYHAMLAATNPDLVAIGPRYVDQHRDMLLAAIESGARGIYIEKPFCRTPAEADEIVAAADRRGVRVAVAHRNRYHPVVPVLERLAAADRIGRVLEIRMRGKEDRRGGLLDLWVLGSHLLNLATLFAGRPIACSAVVLQDGRPVTRADVREGDEGFGPLAGNEVHARFEMEHGVPVFFDSVKNAGNVPTAFGLQLIGTKGIMDFRTDKEPPAHLRAGNPFNPVPDPRAWVTISSGGVGKPEPIAGVGVLTKSHVLAGRDLIAAVRQGREPLCSARDGATTVEMISAVFESHRMGGRRVTLPLATRQNPFARF